MKAPDKIYVSRNFSEDDAPHGLWYLNKSEHDINYEYIRKDALLEWVKMEREKCSDETHPYAQFMNVVIDKLNSI